MKKTILLFAAIITASIIQAQADVTSAFNANKAGEYDKAVTYIEKALTDPKATAKEKTWRYRGNIYLNVAKTPAFASQFPNAVQLAKESYFKAIDIDTNKDFYNENQAALGELKDIIQENAGKEYEKNDFCSAAKSFRNAGQISQKFGKVDSAAIFNTALCNDRCGNIADAIADYRECAKIGYNVPAVYLYISELHIKDGKTDEAKKVIAEARAKYPKDAELLRAEVNFLLVEEKYDQVLDLLVALTAADPMNETIWFVLGTTYEKLNRTTDQENAYKHAVDLNPKYYDALFNLGATYYNQGVEQLKECDKIPPLESAKYDDCTAKANVVFNKSIEQFEKAYVVKPDDKEIVSALMEAYVRVGNVEGQKKMKEALGK